MTSITLSRFYVNPLSYRYVDGYVACLDPNAGTNCPGIDGYMAGLAAQMSRYTDEPRAWSFGQWTRGNNEAKNWICGTAIALEYRIVGGNLDIVDRLHDRAEALGYAHLLLDSLTRAGKPTITIVFPLTDTVNEKQYARLAAVLMEELSVYGSASGNMAATHLIHRDAASGHLIFDGAVIAPAAKIKETEKLYQNMDCRRFEGGGPAAGVHLIEPIRTHEDLFEWSAADAAMIAGKA